MPSLNVQVALIFRSQKANPPLPSNAAPYSGAVAWLRSLRSRIMGKPHGIPIWLTADNTQHPVAQPKLLITQCLKLPVVRHRVRSVP